MNRYVKFIGLLLAAIMLTVSLAACGGGSAADDPTLGTYTGVYYKFVGDSEDSKVENEEFSIVLASGGKGTFKREGTEFNIEWKLDGESFTMKETFLGISIDYTGTLKDGTLDIFNGDPESDFTCEYVLKK